jgi:hypothetical protein
MKSDWFFFSNVFRLLAQRSLKQFYKFCYQFMLGLQSSDDDPFFNDKYQELLPYYNAFKEAYFLKFDNKSNRKGNTIKLKQLLKQLSSSKAHAWDVAIQNVYLNNTPQYAIIFPQGLSPLSLLAIEQRILYLSNAVEMLSNYPQLSTVHNDMKSFCMQLIEARSKQEQKNSEVKESISDVKQKAYDLSDEIYRVLSCFMGKYYKNPKLIKAYFDINLVRKNQTKYSKQQETHNFTIAKSTSIEAGFSFDIHDKFSVSVTGATMLALYFVPDKTLPKPAHYLHLKPQDIKKISVKDYAGNNDRFLMIENLSDKQEGSIEIKRI